MGLLRKVGAIGELAGPSSSSLSSLQACGGSRGLCYVCGSVRRAMSEKAKRCLLFPLANSCTLTAKDSIAATMLVW